MPRVIFRRLTPDARISTDAEYVAGQSHCRRRIDAGRRHRYYVKVDAAAQYAGSVAASCAMRKDKPTGVAIGLPQACLLVAFQMPDCRRLMR